MLIFILMNFIVILSSFLITYGFGYGFGQRRPNHGLLANWKPNHCSPTYRLLRISNFVDSLICWFIVYLSQIILSELILGILGALYLSNVILINLLLLLVIWIFAKSRASTSDLRVVAANKNEFLTNKVILFILSVIFCFSAVKISINLVNPPFGWDSLNYHFTFAVEWLKHGNLDIPITIFDDPSPSYYPINGSLFYLWLMLPLKNVFLADLGQAPFFILSVLAIYSISRKIGLNRELSFYAAALFLLTPNFFKQLQIAYVDVMVASLFLACINFLFLLNEKFSCLYTLLYSMSLGLLLGTKTIALPYSVLLFIPFLYLALKNIKKSYFIIFSILVIAVLGGFSYLRNFIETANPLYPLDFKLFGKTIFRGVMETDIYRAHFKVEDYSLSKLLFHEGLGIQTAILILPAVSIALPIALINKKKNLNFNLIYFLILPILVFLVYRYIIPLANTRYLYPVLGMGNIMGLYTLKMIKLSRRVIAILVVIFVLASIPELAKRQELVTSIIFTLLLFPLMPFLIKSIKHKAFIKSPVFIHSWPDILTLKGKDEQLSHSVSTLTGLKPSGRGSRRLIFLFLTFIVSSLVLLEKDYIKNEFPGYTKMAKYSGFWPDAARAWDWLNKNTPGNNIAYVGRPVPFPLYGNNFKNNVYYVSVNKIEPAKLHYFPDSRYEWGYDFSSLHKNLEAQGNYRSDADYSVWLDNLAKRNIDYLFVYSLHQTKGIEFPMEDSWAKANPARFSLVFGNETIHIYKILR